MAGRKLFNGSRITGYLSINKLLLVRLHEKRRRQNEKILVLYFGFEVYHTTILIL